MTLLSPLPLPRFTFFVGAEWKPACDLAIAIGNRDRNLSFEDILTPIQQATQMLFFGQEEFGRPLKGKLPYAIPVAGGFMTFEWWQRELTELLERHCGGQVLGKMAAERIRQDGDFTTIERYLIRDARGIPDIAPFAALFGKENILCCHFHTNKMNVPVGVRNVFFPTPDWKENLAILEKEFTPIPKWDENLKSVAEDES